MFQHLSNHFEENLSRMFVVEVNTQPFLPRLEFSILHLRIKFFAISSFQGDVLGEPDNHRQPIRRAILTMLTDSKFAQNVPLVGQNFFKEIGLNLRSFSYCVKFACCLIYIVPIWFTAKFGAC